MSQRFAFHCVGVVAFLGSSSAWGQGPDTLIFQAEDHPPFLEIQGAEVGGLFGDVVNRAAEAAGLNIVWQERAFNRTKRDLGEGSAPFCVAGHSATRESAAKWYVSPPIGTFGRSGLLVRAADKEAIDAVPSIEALFTETDYIGGFVTDAVYAVPHLEYLKRSHNKHLFIAGSHEKLAELLARGRIDFVIENEMMAPRHIKGVRGGDRLAFTSLAGMPAGRDAHVICTKTVPRDLLDRFEAGLKAVKKAAR